MEQQKNLYQINLRSVIITYFQNKWIIFLVSLILALCAFLYSTITKSAYYVASSEIYIMDSSATNTSVNYSDLQTAHQLTSDIEQIISNSTVMEPVIDKLGLDISVNKLKSYIKVTAREDTRIIDIAVTHKDPYLAADIANSVREEASEKIVEVTGVDAVNLVSAAQIPNVKHTSGAKRATVFAFLVGLVMSFCVVLVIDIINDTIKSPDEVIEKLGVTTLGSIPYDREIYEINHSHRNESNDNKTEEGADE